MRNVSGIGGFFFRARDPKPLKQWYLAHFGIDPDPIDYSHEPWSQEAGPTVFAPFPYDSGMFGDAKNWMINFRVRDLDALVTRLRAAKTNITVDPETYPNGRFAQLRDPEGNPLQLWEPRVPDGVPQLLHARDLASDATFRNDQEGLRSAIAHFERLSTDGAVGALAHYYRAWCEWFLTESYVLQDALDDAKAAAARSVEAARAAVALMPEDADFQAMLANALIYRSIRDRSTADSMRADLREARRRALELGPKNPRVVMMDAGVLFNDPRDPHAKETGIDRWRQALRLLDEERERPPDSLLPSWGPGLAHAWVAWSLLQCTPPLTNEARALLYAALATHPGFWWATNVLRPLLEKAEGAA